MCTVDQPRKTVSSAPHEPAGLSHGDIRALDLLSDNFLQYMAVERHICHQSLQLGVLFVQLAPLPALVQAQLNIFVLQGKKSLFDNLDLPTARHHLVTVSAYCWPEGLVLLSAFSWP